MFRARRRMPEEAWARRSVELWAEGSWQQSTWLGLPICQLPQDLLTLQELVWQQRPSIVVETGVDQGGSAIFYSSLLSHYGGRRVVSIDIRIPPEVRAAVEGHPAGQLVTLVEADSTAPETIAHVRELVGDESNVMVVLDANHTRAHVRAELEGYAPLVPAGGWLVALDGIMQWIGGSDVSPDLGETPEWVTDSPFPAIHDFVRDHPEFEIVDLDKRYGATFAPDGFLRRLATPAPSPTNNRRGSISH